MDNNVALIAQCEAKAKQWLTPDFDETTRKAVQAMLDNADKPSWWSLSIVIWNLVQAVCAALWAQAPTV